MYMRIFARPDVYNNTPKTLALTICVQGKASLLFVRAGWCVIILFTVTWIILFVHVFADTRGGYNLHVFPA